MRVEPKQRLIDYFSEIEAAISSVLGALRHRQQPQDVHFHLALKACRDGTRLAEESVISRKEQEGLPEVEEQVRAVGEPQP